MTGRILGFSMALMLATACAHVQVAPPTPPAHKEHLVRFEPVIIHSTPEDAQLSDLNDEELFAIGQNAMAAGDNRKADRYFERLADAYPSSKHRPASLQDAGLMLERMKDYQGALVRFMDAAKAYGATPAGGAAQFKVADEYYFLGDYDAAVAALQPLTTASYLTVAKQMEARIKLGVVLYAAGKLDDAEKVFRAAYDEMKPEIAEEYQDGYLPSQAQFYIAEIYRTRFLNVKLDPSKETKEQLSKDLEYKAEMLLSAQGHYLMCIRVGHPEWATASGYRVGELYQLFYEELTNAPAPKDLDPAAVPLYRDELHNRVRNLITKAIHTYEVTLATAERVGATNPFVNETREQLDKMKVLLLNEKPTATEAPPPPVTPPKKRDQS